MTPPLWYTALWLVALLVVAVLWRASQGRDAARRYGGVLVFLGMATALACVRIWAPPRWQTPLQALTLVALWFGLVRAVVVTVDLLARRRRAHFSTILLDLLTLVLYGLVVLAVSGGVLGIQVTPLLATSALLTAVIGLALQETLSNVFGGLSLQMQKPFEPGDWISIGGHLGRVQGIGLRSTQILTRSLDLLDIPNAQLAKEIIVNHRGGASGDELFVGIDYDAPPNRVKEVILEVLKQTSGIVSIPEPRVEVVEYGDSAIRYRLRYWIADYGVQDVLRDSVMTRLWYALRRHALRVPYPIRVLERSHRAPRAEATNGEASCIATLRHVDFLEGIDDADLSVISQWVHLATFAAGEIVCREGDSGDTFYILRRGKAEVVAHGGKEGEFRVAVLDAPSFFGEMSLLLDEPRSATVRATTDVELLVVEREGFQRLFQSRPSLAEAVSRAVAKYKTELQSRREQANHVESDDGRSRRLFARMQAILRF